MQLIPVYADSDSNELVFHVPQQNQHIKLSIFIPPHIQILPLIKCKLMGNIVCDKEVNQLETQGLAIHETLELHEILAFKNVCLTKSKTMQALVSDNNLKSIMQQCVEVDTQHINDVQGLLSRA
jgi:similar to spore coat protein